MYDVCIIGGGVIGCAIARELSRYHLSLVLLEKNSDVAEGTTKANSAIVHAGYDAKPGSNKARTNLAGNRVFADWCHELDVPYKQNTSLVVAFGEEQQPGLTELLARGRQNGVAGLRLIGEAELRRREPNIGPQATGALLAETGGICCPYELTIALGAHAMINGAEIRLNCQVLAVAREQGRFRVTTSSGLVESRILVNAAGVYADEINNQLSEDHFRITPRRGEYWMIDKAYASAFSATIFQLPTKMGKGILVSPTVEGTLILGPTAADVESKEDTRTTAAHLEEILRIAALSWADIPGRSFITAFSGLRAHCDRDDFILGEAPDVPGLFNAAGIESPGLTAAPAIGRELAEQVVAKLSASAKEDFRQPWLPAPRFRFMSLEEKREAIARDPAYGRIICRCEQITEAEIIAAIRRPLGATTLDGVKRRTRAGMGRCQGGFCTPRVLDILSRELNVAQLDLTKFGGRSHILSGLVGQGGEPHVQ
jgi:glycerol-3-phosphate dehydrogenase